MKRNGKKIVSFMISFFMVFMLGLGLGMVLSLYAQTRGSRQKQLQLEDENKNIYYSQNEAETTQQINSWYLSDAQLASDEDAPLGYSQLSVEDHKQPDSASGRTMEEGAGNYQSVNGDGVPLLEEHHIFLLRAKNNCIEVYMDDYQNLYQITNIDLDALPENIQLKIIQGMTIYSEEELYDFLENFTS